jgi:hypothetical protein
MSVRPSLKWVVCFTTTFWGMGLPEVVVPVVALAGVDAITLMSAIIKKTIIFFILKTFCL